MRMNPLGREKNGSMDYGLILIYRKCPTHLPRNTMLGTCEALYIHLYCCLHFSEWAVDS